MGLSAVFWVFLTFGCNGGDDVCFDTDGNRYAPGESIPTNDCNSCGCQRGGYVYCTEIGCGQVDDDGGAKK